MASGSIWYVAADVRDIFKCNVYTIVGISFCDIVQVVNYCNQFV